MRLFKLKQALIALAAAGLVAVPIATRAAGEWGPNRPTFTMANPATYVTFNSITDNTQAIGDERHFYTANQTGVGNYTHSLPVTDNEEVTLRVYYHNNAAANLNLVAFNTNVKMTMPTAAATDQSSVATISATNANPISVFDTVHLTSDKPFTVTYEPGTAKLFNNALNGASLSDSIVTTGAPIGFDQINGQVPGCLNFSGYVTIKVRVHVPQTPPPPTPPTPPTTPPAKPPAPTPAAPTALVNTGPGSDIAIFAIVTIAGTVGYRLYLGRRLSRQ